MKMLKITLEGKTYEVGVEVIDGSSAPVVAPIAAPVAPVVSSAAPVATGEALTETDKTTVQFRPLSETKIERYVSLERPYDCAGGFKSEGLGIALFEKLETTDPNALIGLPLIKLVGLLEKFGLEIPCA